MNKRQKELAQLSLDAEKKVLDELEKEYKRALNDINKKVLQFSGMIERLENAIDSTTNEAQKEILISQRQSKVYQKQYQEALQGQISGILDKMQGDEYATIEQYLKECYEDAYIGTLYDLQGQGIPLIMPIDQAAAVKAITTDSKISKSLYTALGVDVAKLKKTISSEITRGIASSRPYAEIARNLAQAAEIPKNRAKLITRTEGHRIQSASNYNACVDAKAKGADVVKQWSAALDARTRPSHRSLDGQIVEVDEPFKYGNKTAMFPGDFGDPAEDCNCRCRVNQRARWALDESELDRLKERAKYFELDKAKDFEDFKQKYLKAVEKEHIIDIQFFAQMPEQKFTEYALNPDKDPDKAKAFEKALGYTLENYADLMKNINDHIEESRFIEKGDIGYGMRYEYVMRLTGANGKQANVLTAWIQDGKEKRLTSVYVTDKEVTK